MAATTPAGGLGENLLEKNFTLAFSVRLRSLLSARGIQVVTTREQDAAVDVDRRAEIANHAKRASLPESARQRKRAGRSLVRFRRFLPPSRLGFTAWKTAQAAWVTRSLALAGVLNSALQHAGMSVIVGPHGAARHRQHGLPRRCRRNRSGNAPGHGKGGGLDDPDYQARVAGALAAALLEWRTEARQP